jgi:pyruvate-ferredoxin/flavodoxin oxidoreductase
MRSSLELARAAVEAGAWPLYRRDPRRSPALTLDSPPPKEGAMERYMRMQRRFTVVARQQPERFARFVRQAEEDARRRYERLRRLAEADLTK